MLNNKLCKEPDAGKPHVRFFRGVWGAIPISTRPKWKCQFHVVFIPKYRRKVMYGKVKKDVQEIIKTLCEYKKVKITAGAVCVDHVHLCIELPPKYSVSSFMGYLKGKSALMIFARHPEFKTRGDKEFWARGYYVETIGNIDESTVKGYIEKQTEESRKGND